MFALEKNLVLELLRKPAQKVKSEEEAHVLIKTLESFIGPYSSLSAPEIGIQSSAIIIRTPYVSIDLINPEIIDCEEPIISHQESCASFPGVKLNCMRYNKVVLRHGLYDRVSQLTGKTAIFAQHHINHLNGVIFHDRMIKLAEVHEDGFIRKNDPCPCGSRKKFEQCCIMKRSILSQAR